MAALAKPAIAAAIASAVPLLFLILCSEMVRATSTTIDTSEYQAAHNRGRSRTRRERHLEFYMHDLVKAPYPTSVPVIPPINSTNNKSLFGMVVVIDDKLTEGPDPKSREIGRVQGTYTSASLDALQLFIAVTAVFHDDGSTLSFQGSDRAGLVTRDISIVGGTGRFRLARGYASMRTFSFDPPNAVLGFNCTITY